MPSIEIIILQITLIGIVSFAAQWGAWRLRVPAIAFLLVAGFVLGPVLGLIQPHELMGDLLRPAISVAVAIILFEASLNLNFKEIREVQRGVRHMVLIGAPLSWALISLCAHYIAALSWPVAVTFGGLLVVTGPTVIIPLLRGARLNSRIGSILKWEGVINDPLGILFSILAFEYFLTMPLHGANTAGFYIHFLALLLVVVFISVMMGLLVAWLLGRGHIPEYLKSYFLFITVIALYAFCNLIKQESGLLAVTVLGMTLASRDIAGLNEIKRFKETVTLLMVSGVFILLTADLEPSLLLKIDLRGAAFILAILLICRPVSVLISSIGTSLKLKEIILIGWLAPRGVVCAAVAGIMGPLLTEAGFADGEKLLPLAFGIVIVTVLLHSLTAKSFAERLGLAAEADGGLIIVGASDWALQLAQVLKERNIPVMITDKNWHRLKPVRLANMPFFYGEILSEDAEFKIDYSSYGKILAATDNHSYNTLVCNVFAADFGHENVWQLRTPEEAAPESKKMADNVQGKVFVSAAMTYDELWLRNLNGSHFKATKVGPEDSAANEAGLMKNPENIKIGIIRGGQLQFRSPEINPPAREGDILLWLAGSKE